MKITTLPGMPGKNYESPSTRIIELRCNRVLMNSQFATMGSGSEELDELGETSHDAIIWN